MPTHVISFFVGYYSNNAEKLAFPLATNNAGNQLSYLQLLTTQINNLSIF
jgi:hypothetical protein